MAIETVSSAGKGEHNEDLIAVFESETCTDIVILDGATSVADQDYVDPQAGDVVWFVRAFAAALERVIDPALSQDDSVRRAVARVCKEFDSLASARSARETGTATEAVPAYAWPIAALSWARIWQEHDEQGANGVQLYCLGDCKVLLRQADGKTIDVDPWVNPYEAVLQQEVARMAAQGDDPATRLQRMLPMLRARREFQNCNDKPNSLCLRPAGPFDARECDVRLEPGSLLLMMTDGFYRLADPYGLYDNASLADACRERGLKALCAELRGHEASGATSLSVKRADDASAIMWLS